MNQPFFLTQQTASLVEDIVYELNSGSGLLMVYGDRGVGKTRTLSEMSRSGFGKRRVRHIDLQAGSAGDGALVDSSGLIEAVFAEAEAGDVIVADHIEMALKKTRHQLFLSWSDDGIAKGLGLVIVGISDYANVVKELAEQYEVSLKTVHHRALDRDEALAFLGFYLYPDRPASRLEMPPLLRKQLEEARGNISRIVEIAERAGDQISAVVAEPPSPSRRSGDWMVVSLAALFILVGSSWYFLSTDTPTPTASSVRQTAPVVKAPVAPATGRVEKAALPVSGQVEREVAVEADEPVVVELYSESGLEDEAVLIEGIDEADIAEIVSGGTAETSTADPVDDAPIEVVSEQPQIEVLDTATPAVEESVVETVAALDAVPVDSDLDDFSVTVGDPEANRFWRDLARSSAWIDRMDRRTGTVQFMLLNQERFDEETYYDVIDRLEAGGIERDQIRVFETLTGDQPSYSVVYGEFASREAARDAKPNLPEALRVTSPIPRSVGGLRDEIQRLEQRN